MSFLRTLAVILLAAVLLALGLSRAPQPSHGFVGLEFAPLTRTAFARAPQLAPHGALIAYVDPLGPADTAGLKAGEIVTKIGDAPVESAAQAADLVDAHKAGDRLELTVLDITTEDSKPRTIALIVLPGRPPSTKVYTVRPVRTLAREWDFGPAMAANAYWSPRIARGPVKPFPLKLFVSRSCSALAPDGWMIARDKPDGSEFGLQSAGHHVKAIYLRLALPRGDPLALLASELSTIFGQRPQLGTPLALAKDFFIVQYGTLNNYAGFAIYRRNGSEVSLRIAVVPATEVEGLQPLAGAVLLSMRCAGVPGGMNLDPDVRETAVSAKCIAGQCDEGDVAGAYNDRLHTGYVHSDSGDNFLIDPRKDIWVMGPNGPGTYRQIGGAVEKLDPGRTN